MTCRPCSPSIAPRYDLLNRVLSLGVDRGWRREATREALALTGPREGARVLDVATGTADFALELKTAAPQKPRLSAATSCPQMLAIGREQGHRPPDRHSAGGRRRPESALPGRQFRRDHLRVRLSQLCRLRTRAGRISRVLRPNGRLVILEFPPPRAGLFGCVFRFYFRQILPRIGALVSGNAGRVHLPPRKRAGLSRPRTAGGPDAGHGLPHPLQVAECGNRGDPCGR